MSSETLTEVSELDTFFGCMQTVTEGHRDCRWILGIQCVRTGGGWNWLRMVFSGGIWYQRCCTLGFYYHRVSYIICWACKTSKQVSRLKIMNMKGSGRRRSQHILRSAYCPDSHL